MFLLQPQQHPAPRESVSLSLTSQILIKSLMKRNLQKSRSWHFEVLVSLDCNKLWNFTQVILHRELKFWYNLVRTFVSGTEFCLDVQSSLYLICNPSIKPGPLYQVGDNIQNGGQFTKTGRVRYCCWVVIWLHRSLGSIIFVFVPFSWAGFQFALGTRWCRTKRDVSEIFLLRCTPCLSGAGTFYHY